MWFVAAYNSLWMLDLIKPDALHIHTPLSFMDVMKFTQEYNSFNCITCNAAHIMVVSSGHLNDCVRKHRLVKVY